MEEFYRPIRAADTADIGRLGVDREPAIRLYQCQADAISLQIRAPLRLASGGDSARAFMNSTATLTLEDLIALRDAVNAAITELEGPIPGFDRSCPVRYCHGGRGMPCTTASGMPTATHRARLDTK